MASRRFLKKAVNYLTYDLIEECFTYKVFHPEKDAQNIDQVIHQIVAGRNDLIHRINHVAKDSTPKQTRKHFNLVVQDMKSKLVDVMDQLN